jgi:GxxExxY protein
MYSENELASKVVDVCFKIHTMYGPGLFESVYEEIFCHEWNKNTVPFIRQCGIKVTYEGVDMGIGFIPDIMIDNKLILELKSVETLPEYTTKQLLILFEINQTKIGIVD